MPVKVRENKAFLRSATGGRNQASKKKKGCNSSCCTGTLGVPPARVLPLSPPRPLSRGTEWSLTHPRQELPGYRSIFAAKPPPRPPSLCRKKRASLSALRDPAQVPAAERVGSHTPSSLGVCAQDRHVDCDAPSSLASLNLFVLFIRPRLSSEHHVVPRWHALHAPVETVFRHRPLSVHVRKGKGLGNRR